PGGGTLLNLAACNEKSGKIATAWAEYNEALSQAIRDGRGDRQKFAREHIDSLGPQLPRVVISVADSPSADVEVRIDDVPLGRAAWGVATPVDPGSHVVVGRAPGRLAYQHSITVAIRDTLNVDIPVLERDPAAPTEPV